MMASNEKRFIPSFIFSSVVNAIIAPYLSIMLRDLGYSPVWVGILLGLYSGAGIAGPIILGHLADKTGNYRPVLIISSIIPALIIFPLIRIVHPTVSIILLALLAFGLRAVMSLLDAITTIQIGRTGNYGKIRVWGSLSFVCMTLFLQWTPFLKPDSAANIGLWIFIASIVSVIPVLLLPGAFLRSCVEHHSEESGVETEAGNISPAVSSRIKISAYALGGFVTIFLCSFSMSSVYTYFPLYLTEFIRWDMVGLMFGLATISEVPIIFLSSAMVRRFGSLPLLSIAAAGIVLRLLIWAFLPFKPCILASQLLHALCFGVFHPAAVYFIAGIFPARKRGIGMSVYMALGSGLPALIGNMAGGAIVEAVGYQFLFALYAAIAGVAFVICNVARKWLVTFPDKSPKS
jgi:PPP family 3-phenylpropionic acid transporter